MSHELESRSGGSDPGGGAAAASEPGKRTLTGAVQRKASATPAAPSSATRSS